jgi:prepilin-type N-terminal cleavage/methylation domain-containing protein
MKMITTQNNKGFTMIETLVAIFILLITITGPLAISQSGLKAAFLARDQTIAFYLAQDAMEYIKNIRDTNFIKRSDDNRDWLEGLENCMNGNICTVDTTETGQDAIESCTAVLYRGCSDEDDKYSPLVIDNSTGHEFIGFNGSEQSKFFRTVKIDNVRLGQEVQVTVTVGWETDDGVLKKIISKENIFNWAPNYNND